MSKVRKNESREIRIMMEIIVARQTVYHVDHCRALFGTDGSMRRRYRHLESPHPPGIRICTWPTHLTQADNPTQHCIIAMFIVTQHCNNAMNAMLLHSAPETQSNIFPYI